MDTLLHILDWFLFACFTVNVLYLLVYSVASRRSKSVVCPHSDRHLRMAVLIPAYGEDAVIEECVQACLAQTYPSTSYTVVVVSDHMKSETNARLARLPIRFLEVHFQQSTKVKALNAAMQALGDDYEVALVLDADNLIPPDYLMDLNHYMADPKVEVVQTHRKAKNLNNPMALLDAVSEEINNSIFRLGHANLGMSAALIGSGMAFRYTLFRNVMADMRSVGGFDRELELRLLYRRKSFHYLPETCVWDEKIQSTADFSRQRRRWLSAQFHYAAVFANCMGPAIRDRKWDFCDKLFQQFILPRLLLVGFLVLGAVGLTLFCPLCAVKWWLLLGLLLVALLLAIPASYYTRRLFIALLHIPRAFQVMLFNLFRLHGANRQFIHTRHGIGE